MKRWIVLLPFISFSTHAQVYKWLDEKGGVHYGDKPPASVEAQTLDAPPPPSDAPSSAEMVNRYERAMADMRSMRAPERSVSKNKYDSREPVDIGYEDRLKIRALNNQLSSHLSTPQERSAAKAELAEVYARYGMHPSRRHSSRKSHSDTR